MGTFVEWADSNPTKTGEPPAQRMMQWVNQTQKKLLAAFPKGEQAFCRIFHKMKSRLPKRWESRLRYTRQKTFLVAPEIVFFGDFYFRNARLLVEIDGNSHAGETARVKDEWRTKLVQLFRHTTVLRFTNDQVISGDFRHIEKTFVNAISSVLPHQIGSKLLSDYITMKKHFPAIYQAQGVVGTFR